ncbi:Alpha/beta hydrolase fold-1 [Fusarium flagelliforme]|uniref:Alpha/beta hydrolase fold-1 n=1 Tax=Fusarium flagelliforme TaxID=2675880 RepID=UPI001E8DBC4D|nr:Alpha/beta hydrolase fold-1 [Fusarium flagelliforme]KAH7186002.1 Alpha/beta hydrolase fold-1 [Fusarium flagelliforme]
MRASMLPTILAVPGAWHTVESFDTVKKIFTDRNYDFVSQNAPGVVDANSTVTGDAASLRTNLLQPLVEAGKDVIVMMHSYGGMYGSQAVQGLSKRERKESGKQGGVVSLVYVSAVTPLEGQSTLDMMGTDAQHLPSWVVYNENTGFVTFTGAKEVMYHDIPDDVAAHYIPLLRPQSLNSMNTPVTYSPLTDPNFEGTAGYVLCGADRVVPLTGQEQYAAIGGIGRTILVEQASHAFFATAPNDTVNAVLELSQI